MGSMKYNNIMKVKVVQLNIWRGTLLDNALAFLREEDPDIILLQEVYSSPDENLPSEKRLYEYLNEELPDYYATYGVAFTDITEVGNIQSGNAIFSKFEITDSENTFFDEPYREFNEQAQTDFSHNPQTILRAVLNADGVTLNAFSVHGIWGTDGEDNPRRKEMGDIIISEIKDKENVIMGGDFNLLPHTETVKNIEKHVDSVFKESLARTFNMKYKTDGGYATAAVDMIFVSQGIKVLDKKCLDIQVSDHLPLVVELEA